MNTIQMIHAFVVSLKTLAKCFNNVWPAGSGSLYFVRVVGGYKIGV